MMTKRIGLVNRSMENQLAEVITDRKGGCGGCQPVHGCRTCLSSAKLVSVVQNTANAVPGDVVAIEISSKGLWAGAVLFYLWPIVCLLAGAAAAQAPANDECAGATVIDAIPYATTQDTRLATDNPADPSLDCADGGGGKTVWFWCDPGDKWLKQVEGYTRRKINPKDPDPVLGAQE